MEQLIDLQRHALNRARRDGLVAEDELFYVERNAKTVTAAAEYYRSMFDGRISSWNLRDHHMVDTLEALAEHLGRQRGEAARIVVWAQASPATNRKSIAVACGPSKPAAPAAA